MAVDEAEVKTRHKRLRKKLLEEDTEGIDDYGRERQPVNSGLIGDGQSGFQGDYEQPERTLDGSQEPVRGSARGQGTTRGYDTRERETFREPVNSTESTNTMGTGYETGVTSGLKPRDMTYEERREHDRELARQRKARERDRARIAAQTGELSVKSDGDKYGGDSADDDPPLSRVSNPTITPDARPAFRLKIPGLKSDEKEAPPVKLITKTEAEENLEKLVWVYVQGSKLLDDVLEIVVKGHEKVTIWALSEDEALMLADMQMEQAKTNKQAARTVRKLLEIHDRFYIYMIVLPRMKATGEHIISHKGVGFK